MKIPSISRSPSRTGEGRQVITVERRERPMDPGPKPPSPSEEGGGPRRPDTNSPGKDNLMKRMRKVNPKQAERYRQRTGE